jgi:biotin operon repressor
MNSTKRESKKARILKLAELKSTGTPAELGKQLEMSERSVKRLVMEMRQAGHDISYCAARRSYVLENNYQ